MRSPLEKEEEGKESAVRASALRKGCIRGSMCKIGLGRGEGAACEEVITAPEGGHYTKALRRRR
jgi:hypothetical protein